MQNDYTELSILTDPNTSVLKADPYQFLLSLTGPTIVDITGKNTNKTCVVITLINGNEPSGLIAIHRWLTEREIGTKPYHNLRFIFCSVEAALLTPLLSNSHLPNQIALTQCFGVGFNHGIFKRAKLIESSIRDVKPAIVVSLHNTPSYSPAFACAASLNNESVGVAQCFVETIVLSEQMPDRLQTLNFDCTNLAVYTGSPEDPQSHEVALYGIELLADANHRYVQNNSANVLLHPKRLMLSPTSKLSFSELDEGNSGVTLRKDIDALNFRPIKSGQHLGWLDEKGLANLCLLDHHNNVCTERFLTTRSNQLIAATNMTIFLAPSVKCMTEPTSIQQEFIFYVLQN
ncbi:hypothetical protein [Thalassotalea fusca]